MEKVFTVILRAPAKVCPGEGAGNKLLLVPSCLDSKQGRDTGKGGNSEHSPDSWPRADHQVRTHVPEQCRCFLYTLGPLSGLSLEVIKESHRSSEKGNEGVETPSALGSKSGLLTSSGVSVSTVPLPTSLVSKILGNKWPASFLLPNGKKKKKTLNEVKVPSRGCTAGSDQTQE